MPQDDNAAASANARAGLGSLGDFLYRNKVQKPLTQAQTAATQQQTQQSGDLFNASTLPQAKIATQVASRNNQLEQKNLYLSQIQKPDVSDDFSNTAGSNGVKFPTPHVDMPWQEAIDKGYISPEDAASVQQPPPNWIVPYDNSRPFLQQPSAVQEKMVDKAIANNPNPDIPLTRADVKSALAQQDFRESMATLPPITPYSLPGGVKITKLSGGPAGVQWEGVANPGAQRITNESGQPTGYTMVNGEVKPDTMALTPKDVTERQQSVADIEKSQQQVSQVQDMLNKNPELVGRGIVSGGSFLPREGRNMLSYVSNNANFGKQKLLNQFLTGQLLNTLGQVHIGRVTEMEWNQLRNNIPSQDSPKEVWDDYLGRLQDALSKSHDFQTEALRQNGVTSPETNGGVPPVRRSTQVSPPETGRVGNSSNAGSVGGAEQLPTINSQAEYQALPSKTRFSSGGKTYIKP